MQLKRHGSRFYRGGRATVILLGKFSKAELATGLAAKTKFAAAFPKKIHVQFGRLSLRAVHKAG